MRIPPQMSPQATISNRNGRLRLVSSLHSGTGHVNALSPVVERPTTGVLICLVRSWASEVRGVGAEVSDGVFQQDSVAADQFTCKSDGCRLHGGSFIVLAPLRDLDSAPTVPSTGDATRIGESSATSSPATWVCAAPLGSHTKRALTDSPRGCAAAPSRPGPGVTSPKAPAEGHPQRIVPAPDLPDDAQGGDQQQDDQRGERG